MPKSILRFIFATCILILISSILFEVGNFLVKQIIIIDSSNSYLFRTTFLEIVGLSSFVIGIPYFIFRTIVFFIKVNSKYEILFALSIEFLFFYFMLWLGSVGNLNDPYIQKNVVVFLTSSMLMPFIMRNKFSCS